jgi:hypothetical protein
VSSTEAPERPRTFPQEELHELQEAAAALRHEIENRFGGLRRGSSGPALWMRQLRDETRARVARLDVLRLYEELRRRVAFLGMEERSSEVDEFGLDPTYLRGVRPILDFLYERWWRVRVVGVERIPSPPRALFVSNRSGVLPYDGLMLAHAVEREHPDHLRPRFLVADWAGGRVSGRSERRA